MLALLLTLQTHGFAKTKPVAASVSAVAESGTAEARLLEIYHMMANGRTREALALAAGVVRDHPNFQLAQLVYAELLAARTRPVHTLGVYYVTSNLNPREQFSRAPQASDGCLVMANPDLVDITVEVGSTPVVIATQLQWVDAHNAKTESKPFGDTLQAWRTAKVGCNLDRVMSFHMQEFNSCSKTLEQWSGVMHGDLARAQGHDIELKDVSMLRWTDSADTMVVTFGEVLLGQRTDWTKRQYWTRQSGQWKIFFEGTL